MGNCPSQHILAWLQRMTTPIKGITLCTLLENYLDKVKAHILLKCFDNGLLQQPISSYIRLTAGVWNTFGHSCSGTIWRLMGGPGRRKGRRLLSPIPPHGLGKWHMRLNFLCDPNRTRTPVCIASVVTGEPGIEQTASASTGFLLMDFEDKKSPAALESTPGILVICTSLA